MSQRLSPATARPHPSRTACRKLPGQPFAIRCHCIGTASAKLADRRADPFKPLVPGSSPGQPTTSLRSEIWSSPCIYKVVCTFKRSCLRSNACRFSAAICLHKQHGGKSLWLLEDYFHERDLPRPHLQSFSSGRVRFLLSRALDRREESDLFDCVEPA